MGTNKEMQAYNLTLEQFIKRVKKETGYKQSDEAYKKIMLDEAIETWTNQAFINKLREVKLL